MNLNNIDKERVEAMERLVRKIQESGLQLDDIRKRTWMTSDSNVGKILSLLIETENLLIDLDEYLVHNNPELNSIEDFMLELGYFRDRFTSYVDKNSDLVNVKTFK